MSQGNSCQKANQLPATTTTAPISKAANLAVGIFVAGSLGGYEYCWFRIRQSRANMRRAVEVMQQRQLDEKVKKAEEARRAEQERERVRLADEAAVQAVQKRWYKFW